MLLGRPARGQDVGWLVDQAPVVSAVLVKALEKSPSFSAHVEVHVSGTADPVATTGAGTLDSQNSKLRWRVKLGDIRSAQLSQNARAVVRQLNGDYFFLLTRPDKRFNYVVLPGAHALLEQPLPSIKLSSKLSSTTETVGGRLCSKEKINVTSSEGATNTVFLWRAKDLKNIPVQIEMTDGGERIRVQLSEVQFRTMEAAWFDVPGGLSKYASVEDMVQSVLVSKMRKRMGLD